MLSLNLGNYCNTVVTMLLLCGVLALSHLHTSSRYCQVLFWLNYCIPVICWVWRLLVAAETVACTICGFLYSDSDIA